MSRPVASTIPSSAMQSNRTLYSLCNAWRPFFQTTSGHQMIAQRHVAGWRKKFLYTAKRRIAKAKKKDSSKKRKRYEYRFLVYSVETDALIKTDMSQ